MSMIVAQADVAASERVKARRTESERLVELAQHFCEEDRLLVEHVYDLGVPIARLARITGQPASRLHRRLARLIARANDPLFRYVIAHHELIEPEIKPVADLIVCRGYSLRRAARETRRTLHTIRTQLFTLRVRAGVV